MGVSSFHRGHRVYALQDSKGVYSDWRYSDGSKLKEKGDRPCVRCGKMPTEEGHDHCIANLPGVQYACCGHGVEDGYVKLYDGQVITFGTHLKRDKIIDLIELYKNRKK